MRRVRTAPVLGGMAALVLSFGCTGALRNAELEKVAKDWSLVIRASQVIPVYPLTEDLQPGDVLLVSTPIEDQVETYEAKGFLPLDQHLVRLYSDEFHDFYNERYGTEEGEIPPAKWQADGWELAPIAAFPSYQFSVRTGSGLNLAIPIQGIPLALGFMNSGSASGTVTIADAHTFGLDNVRMEKLVREWGRSQRRLLRNYAPQNGEYHFLRVISRVYTAGQVNVIIRNDEAMAAEVAAGADRPVELRGIEEGATDRNFQGATRSSLARVAAEQVPGGRLKIATATSRAVTMSEKFARPLVIGYVGFDLPILPGGRLGAPISTLAQLMQRRTLPARSGGQLYRLAALAHMVRALDEIDGVEADLIRADLDALERLLPEEYPFTLYEFSGPDPREVVASETVAAGDDVEGDGFRAVLDYLGNAQTTIEVLEAHLRAVSAPERQADLSAAREAVEQIRGRLIEEPALMGAIDFVFLGT